MHSTIYHGSWTIPETLSSNENQPQILLKMMIMRIHNNDNNKSLACMHNKYQFSYSNNDNTYLTRYLYSIHLQIIFCIHTKNNYWQETWHSSEDTLLFFAHAAKDLTSFEKLTKGVQPIKQKMDNEVMPNFQYVVSNCTFALIKALYMLPHHGSNATFNQPSKCLIHDETLDFI